MALCTAFDKCVLLNVPLKVATKPVFKDKKVSVFYTSDLGSTPKDRFAGPNDHSIESVHGVELLEHWNGAESLHRPRFEVPSVILACNMFMNCIDRFDQLRATNPIMPKTQRAPMSVFIFLIDASIQNGYAVLHAWSTGGNIRIVHEFKRRINEQLANPLIDFKNTGRSLVSKLFSSTEEVLEIAPVHHLLENKGKRQGQCYLSKLMRQNKKRCTSIYSCPACSLAFHVKCLAVYHNLKDQHRDRGDV
ncbi:hypothetical protein BWQ96_04093 [Gracilariopsis chorda]|uniref:Uncharacterized protein n=1 Tax=Gracilariopsis chorda TaxID=448386 RepID=A0A2V3IWJ6_9FLOR|nr:hypothetical protein BWQ96_04093 [Gracilariopsis chorda]|eukprot:PXF46087.1 hypothetical protein BWQ96_04093 [Gracilariopsis chorda]